MTLVEHLVTASWATLFGYALLLIPAYIVYVSVMGSIRKKDCAFNMPSSFFMGAFPTIKKQNHRIHDFVAETMNENKVMTIGVPLPLGRKFTLTAEPRNVKVMLTKPDVFCIAKGVRYESVTDLFGNGIFCADGHAWLEQRKGAQWEFSQKKFRDYYSRAFTEKASKMREIITVDTEKNASLQIDLASMFMDLTIESFVKIAFGVELGTLDNRNKDPFSCAFDDAQERCVVRAREYAHPAQWKFKRFFNLGEEKVMADNIAVVDSTIHDIIDKRTNMSDDELGQLDDLLSRLISVTKSDKEFLPSSSSKKSDSDSETDTPDMRFVRALKSNPKAYLRDMIVNFLVAGRDTTACGLAWMFNALADHPDVEQKVLEEIDDKLQGEIPDYDNIKDLNYLQATVSEALRLHPSVPQDGKFCNKTTVMPDGTTIREGNGLAYHPYAMARLPELWGDDCAEFKPERWLDDAGYYKKWTDEF
eukprot:gene4777-2350_t